jgi:hypothetical protein
MTVNKSDTPRALNRNLTHWYCIRATRGIGTYPWNRCRILLHFMSFAISERPR